MPNRHFRINRVIGCLVLSASLVSCEPAEEVPGEINANIPESPLPRVETLVSSGSGLIGGVSAMALDPSGSVWIADEVNHRLLRVSPDGQTRLIGREGSGPGEFRTPRGIGVGGVVEVHDYSNGRIQRLSLSGEYLDSYPANVPLLPPVAMNGNGVVVGGTHGRDNSLAVMVGSAVDGESLRGEARAGTPQEISLARLREQAQAGEIPEEISNSIVPIVGPRGELWLAVQADAMVEHYDENGEPVWSRQLNLPETQAAFGRFFEGWDGPVEFSSMPFPWVVRGGALVGDELWLMMDAVGDEGSVILRLVASSGDPIDRLVLPIEGRGGPFVVDRERGFLYTGDGDTGSLFRVALP